jgi:hypothetical protein
MGLSINPPTAIGRLLHAAECEIRPDLCFSAHDDNGFMVVMMVVVVVVVPSVVSIHGRCRERRTQQRHTEQ